MSTIPVVEPAGYHCKVRHHATPHCSYTYTFRKIVVRDTPPAASGAGDYLAVAIVTSLILAVARGGDRSWTALKNHRDLMAGYDDAIVHGGRGFAVDVTDRVFAWDLPRAAGSRPDPERLPAAPGPRPTASRCTSGTWAAVTVSRGPPGQVARPNCVYAAPAVLFGYQDEDFDVVVHDLDDGSCRQIKVSDRDEDEDGFVIPIWFTPTLQMWSRRAS